MSKFIKVMAVVMVMFSVECIAEEAERIVVKKSEYNKYRDFYYQAQGLMVRQIIDGCKISIKYSDNKGGYRFEDSENGERVTFKGGCHYEKFKPYNLSEKLETIESGEGVFYNKKENGND